VLNPTRIPWGVNDNKYPESKALVSLARLGVDSGGTLTERTNASDMVLDLALRRAAGTYTLSFKDEGPHDGRPRSVEVWLRPTGLRAVHAALYASRSEAMKRESLLQAAYVSPALFDTGAVHASLIPLSPRSRSTWRAQLVISFPVQPRAAGETGQDAKLEAAVSRGGDVIQELVHNVTPPAGETAVSTLIESIDLKPGKYTVAAVLSDPGSRLPRATSVEVEVPAMPIGSAPVLLGPVLGSRPSGTSVVFGEGVHPSPSERVAPLVESNVDPGSELAILTCVCVPPGKRAERVPGARRVLRTVSGQVVLEFAEDDVTVGDDQCARHLDLVPPGTLAPGGAYVFEAGLGTGAGATRSVQFTAATTAQNVAASR